MKRDINRYRQRAEEEMVRDRHGRLLKRNGSKFTTFEKWAVILGIVLLVGLMLLAHFW